MSWVWERELHYTSEHQSLLHWLQVKLNFPGYTEKCLSTCLVQKLRTGSHSSTGNALCDSQFSYTLLRVWTPPSCDSRHGSKWLFSFVLWGSYAQTFPILLYSNQFSSLCSFRVQVDFFLNYIPKLGHIFYDFVLGQKRHTELHQVRTDQSRYSME